MKIKFENKNIIEVDNIWIVGNLLIKIKNFYIYF